MKITPQPGNWEENASSKIRKIDIQSENKEVATMEDEDGEDDDDGPPPGFHFVIAAPLLQAPKANAREAVEEEEEEVDANEVVEEEEDANEAAAEEEEAHEVVEEEEEDANEAAAEEEEAHESVEEEEEEEEGPPPGFHSVAPKQSRALPCADMARSSEEEHSDDDDDDDDDVDGPPPGWEFSIPLNALAKSSSDTTDERMESDEDLDEGPPPGWEIVLPNQMTPAHIPPLQQSLTPTSCLEIESKLKIATDCNKVRPVLSEFTPTPRHSSPATPPLEQLPSTEPHHDPGSKEDGKNDGDRSQISEDQLIPLQQKLPRSPGPSLTVGPSSSEKAQLVCGTCQKLCLYPVGTKWVQCPTCKEVNFVLEAHEVGQVNCGGCPVLLMYPYGAPAVQCSSCHFVTQIGAFASTTRAQQQQGSGLA